MRLTHIARLVALASVALVETSGVAQNTFPASGNVGIGTTSPGYQLDIQSYTSHSRFVGLDIFNTYIGGDGSTALVFDEGNAEVVSSQAGTPGSSMRNLDFYTSNGSTANLAVRIATSGNVGIGTTSPGAALEVNGSVKLSAGSGASVTFADGTVQSTAWTGALCGGMSVGAKIDHRAPRERRFVAV